MRSCEKLRVKLYKIEKELNLYEMHKRNNFKPSFVLTIIGSAITLVAFIVLLLMFVVIR